MEVKLPTSNKRIAKTIMALITNRKKVLSKGFFQHASFILGNNIILLGLREVIVGDTKFKLPKPKNEDWKKGKDLV